MNIPSPILKMYTGATKRVSIAALLSIAAFVGIAAYAILHDPNPRTYVIELRDTGFFPAELTVRNGDTVLFKNVGTRDVWPASDPHPTHDDLSSFDPTEGIEPGQ